jgi:hypothetical protein
MKAHYPYTLHITHSFKVINAIQLLQSFTFQSRINVGGRILGDDLQESVRFDSGEDDLSLVLEDEGVHGRGHPGKIDVSESETGKLKKRSRTIGNGHVFTCLHQSHELLYCRNDINYLVPNASLGYLIFVIIS